MRAREKETQREREKERERERERERKRERESDRERERERRAEHLFKSDSVHVDLTSVTPSTLLNPPDHSECNVQS